MAKRIIKVGLCLMQGGKVLLARSEGDAHFQIPGGKMVVDSGSVQNRAVSFKRSSAAPNTPVRMIWAQPRGEMCDEQVQTCDPEVLAFRVAIADFALSIRRAHFRASPSLRPMLARRCMSVSSIHSMMNSVRSTRPISRRAMARSYCLGRAASFFGS